MKKKLTIALAAILLLTGCGKTVPKLENGSEVFVSFADGTQITVDDIWGDLKEDYALNATLTRINKKILEEEYADKVSSAEAYAETMVTSLKANYTDESTLNSVLSYYGYASIDAYKEEQYLNQLTNYAVIDYVGKNVVTEKEMKQYYEDEVVGDIDCDHILVTPASDDDEALEAAKTKAEEIIAAIDADVKSGTSAKDAFAKYKDDSSVTYQALGSFNKGDMVDEFETAAYALKVGSYSATPVKTSYGYHIILKNSESEKASYEDKESEIRETLAQEKIDADENSTYETNCMIELRKKYGVTWYDSDTEEQYNRYMNNLLNQD